MKRVENEKDIARLMFASITRPINAALAGAGTLFAVAGLHNPLLAVVGFGMLVGTAGSVTLDLKNKEFIEGAMGDGSDGKALPEIPENLSGQYRFACLEAKRHLDKTIEIMEAAGPEMADELRPMRDQVAENVESVYRLAEKAHQIETTLTGDSRNEITKEIEKIRAQLVLTSDPVTRQYLEATRRQHEERLAEYDELARRVRRIQAKMQNVNAGLHNVQFKVMKIGTADLRSGASQVDEVTQSLQQLLTDVSLFERSLDSAYGEEPRLSAHGSLESWDERADLRNRLPPGAADGGDVPGGVPSNGSATGSAGTSSQNGGGQNGAGNPDLGSRIPPSKRADEESKSQNGGSNQAPGSI